MVKSPASRRSSRDLRIGLERVLAGYRHEFPPNVLLTITETVVVEGNLRVHFSVVPDDLAEVVMGRLQDLRSEIQWKWGRLVGRQVGRVPKLVFLSDTHYADSVRMIQRLERFRPESH